MIPSPLHNWVNRKTSLPARFYGSPPNDSAGTEWCVSVALEEVLPLHAVADAHWQSLSETRRLTNEYLASAGQLIDGLWGGSLDNEERDLILSELGQPPEFCLPIYLITAGEGEQERVVYVGKTCSASRFRGGHAVALKLHHPEYEGLKKRVYRCSVLLHIHDQYLAMEWVEPEQFSKRILDLIESVLIYVLQPALNTAKRRRAKLGRPVFVHLQNFVETKLLDDLMLRHSDDSPLQYCGALPYSI